MRAAVRGSSGPEDAAAWMMKRIAGGRSCRLQMVDRRWQAVDGRWQLLGPRGQMPGGSAMVRKEGCLGIPSSIYLSHQALAAPVCGSPCAHMTRRRRGRCAPPAGTGRAKRAGGGASWGKLGCWGALPLRHDATQTTPDGALWWHAQRLARTGDAQWPRIPSRAVLPATTSFRLPAFLLVSSSAPRALCGAVSPWRAAPQLAALAESFRDASRPGRWPNHWRVRGDDVGGGVRGGVAAAAQPAAPCRPSPPAPRSHRWSRTGRSLRLQPLGLLGNWPPEDPSGRSSRARSARRHYLGDGGDPCFLGVVWGADVKMGRPLAGHLASRQTQAGGEECEGSAIQAAGRSEARPRAPRRHATQMPEHTAGFRNQRLSVVPQRCTEVEREASWGKEMEHG